MQKEKKINYVSSRLKATFLGGAVLALSLPLSASDLICNRAGPVSMEVAQAASNEPLKWCCCGTCCGWSTNCEAVPGCTSCRE